MSPIIDFLIVDDEDEWQVRLLELIGDEHTAKSVKSLDEAKTFIREQFSYCALVDKSLIPHKGDDEGGMRILEMLANQNEGTKGLMLTSYPDIPSVKAALQKWKVTDYILKKDITTVEGLRIAQDQLNKMLAESKKEYSTRYASGIRQLTGEFNPQDIAGWESSVIMMFATQGKRVDFSLWINFLDHLMKEISPIYSYNPSDPMKIDNGGIVSGNYWSKGLGKSIVVKFGLDHKIEAEINSLPSEMVIRNFSKGSLRGVLLHAGLTYEDLIAETKGK